MYIIKEFFPLSNDIYGVLIGRELRKLFIKNLFFHFNFLNLDISLTIHTIHLRFSVCIHKVILQGSVSRIFDSGPSFYYFYGKKRVTFCLFLQYNFLYFIKWKLGPK